MTEILFSVRLSVFCWSMLGRGSFSAAFLLPCPEKGVVWSIPRWTHPTRIAVVALVLTDLVSISGNAATGRATWRHLSSSTVLFTTNEHLDKTHQYQQQKLSDLIRPPLLHPALNVVYFLDESSIYAANKYRGQYSHGWLNLFQSGGGHKCTSKKL